MVNSVFILSQRWTPWIWLIEHQISQKKKGVGRAFVLFVRLPCFYVSLLRFCCHICDGTVLTLPYLWWHCAAFAVMWWRFDSSLFQFIEPPDFPSHPQSVPVFEDFEHRYLLSSIPNLPSHLSPLIEHLIFASLCLETLLTCVSECWDHPFGTRIEIKFHYLTWFESYI